MTDLNDVRPGDTAAMREALAAYRQSLIHEMVLPESGLVFRLKRIGMEELMVRGEIPDSLSGIVDKMLSSGKSEFDLSELTSGDLKLMSDMYGTVVLACVQWPLIADGDGDDVHLGLNDILYKDKEAIFNWANGEAHALKSFRGESKESGPSDPAALDGEGVRETAV